MIKSKVSRRNLLQKTYKLILVKSFRCIKSGSWFRWWKKRIGRGAVEVSWNTYCFTLVTSPCRRATKTEIRNALIRRMIDPEMKRILFKSCLLIAVSKGFAVASPWFLKGVIDAMNVASPNLNTLWLGIGAFGLTRLFSTISAEYRMLMITDFISKGLRKI